MPVKKKSRVTSRRNRQKPGNRAGAKQGASGPLPQRRTGPDRGSRLASQEDLWVAEKTSLSRQEDVVVWTPRTVTPSDARLLELADIALGLRKPEPFRRRKSAFFSGNRSRSSTP